MNFTTISSSPPFFPLTRVLAKRQAQLVDSKRVNSQSHQALGNWFIFRPSIVAMEMMSPRGRDVCKINQSTKKGLSGRSRYEGIQVKMCCTVQWRDTVSLGRFFGLSRQRKTQLLTEVLQHRCNCFSHQEDWRSQAYCFFSSQFSWRRCQLDLGDGGLVIHDTWLISDTSGFPPKVSTLVWATASSDTTPGYTITSSFYGTWTSMELWVWWFPFCKTADFQVPCWWFHRGLWNLPLQQNPPNNRDRTHPTHLRNITGMPL